MAILMTFQVPGGTVEQYDRVNELMGLSHEAEMPDGLIGHVCATTGDGLTIVDVWESEEQLHAFFESRLKAALEQAGIAASPPQIHPVYNGFRGRSAAA